MTGVLGVACKVDLLLATEVLVDSGGLSGVTFSEPSFTDSGSLSHN